MSEETSGTPTEYVGLSTDGSITLSPEALDAMDNVRPTDDTPVNSEEATPAPEVEVQATPSRKIKHNGQEVEVSPSDEVALLQKGYDYDFKMAALETERARLQQYNGLVSAIEASPDVRQKVSEALGYQKAAPVPEVPQFDDPIEQLKWEIKQETRRELEEQYFKPMQQQTAQTQHQNHLNGVRQQVQADPQFKEIQSEIIKTIKALPESVGKDLYARLDQDPLAYTDMFNSVKARLKLSPSNQPQSTEVPEPTKRESKAPLLESGNNDVPAASEQQRQTERIKELTKKSKAGDFRATGELMTLMA